MGMHAWERCKADAGAAATVWHAGPAQASGQGLQAGGDAGAHLHVSQRMRRDAFSRDTLVEAACLAAQVYVGFNLNLQA